MSQNISTAALPAPSPARTGDGEGRRTGAGRLVGVDLARGLAVFGMFAAHVGPDPSTGGTTGFLMELSHGRASALFAVLAGFSLVLMTGRRVPKTGRDGQVAVARILIRSAVLLVLGTALTMTGTQVEVILAYYGLYFVLALPLYRLGARTLAWLAAGAALVLPQALYLVQDSISSGTWAERVAAHDPLARISGTDGLVDLFFTGSYPVLTWMPFVLAGMAVAKLDLGSRAVLRRLAAAGGALAVLGYGGSWLALNLFHSISAAVGAVGDGPVMSAWWSDAVGDPTGDTPAWLLVAAPHSETTPSILGNTGVALLVLAACIVAADALPRFRRAAWPVVAVGRISLTAYVLHIAAIWALGIGDVPGSPLPVLLGFVAAFMLLAVVWLRFFQRGPLEYLMYKVTGIARLVPESPAPQPVRTSSPQ
ncbi:DUF418 domain-containing protein [Streptomyces morookaense]|uniref:DUF418 domain-containing protein n=1 Tax=Streptomyces morookaense TaxID=1970 RepID=UPI0033FA604A